MQIPNGAIVPLYIASFIMLGFQYYRLNPERRLLNLHFGMMAGAVVLMLFAIFLTEALQSLILFALALLWVGLTLFFFRHLPPPRV
jgi:hypothetical protein